MDSNCEKNPRVELLKKAKNFPDKSGCYLFYNSLGVILYVGKAKNLRSRVSSYFHVGVKNIKTQMLVDHIVEMNFMITSTEVEAFILENNLIKEHAPKFNVRLKDDRNYPYVVVDNSLAFPRLEYSRRPKLKKGRSIFGPFAVGSHILAILRTLTKVFQLRDCTLKEMSQRREPCILYEMQHCSAPCVGKIAEDDYRVRLNLAIEILGGKGRKAIKYLRQKMLVFSEGEEFEKAALLRDQIEEIENFMKSSIQKNVEFPQAEKNLDVISCFYGKWEVDISLYLFRRGLLIGNKNFHFAPTGFFSEENQTHQDVISFLLQYYTNTFEAPPDCLLVNFPEEDLLLLDEVINKSLGNFSGKKLGVRGATLKEKGLIELVTNQARETQRMRLASENDAHLGLLKLQKLLDLTHRPRVIECMDIAIWQGDSPAGSKISFHEGRPDKKAYRHYHLEKRPEGNNDLAMLKELMERRLKDKKLPDLFVVDGGWAQVNVLKKVLDEFNVLVPLVGVAKGRNVSGKKTEERLIIPGQVSPFVLKSDLSLYRLITLMRDEAHRFARRLHHKREGKRLIEGSN